MRINVITNIDNGKGLTRDYWLLRDHLMERGHEVVGVQFDHHMHQLECPRADVNIFCETIKSEFCRQAERNLAFVNPEWWLPEYEKASANMDVLLCKTQDAERIFSTTGKARYVGFIAEDKRDTSIKRLPKFLHVAGGSRAKNTESVVACWREYGVPAELVIVGQHYGYSAQIAGIELHSFVSAKQMHVLQNQCQFHICPSGYEGFGHYIHEGMSTGNVLLVADAPPMNESNTLSYLKIPVASTAPFRAAQFNIITAEAVRDCVLKALQMTPKAIQQCGGKLRNQYERQQAEFDVNMQEVLR